MPQEQRQKLNVVALGCAYGRIRRGFQNGFDSLVKARATECYCAGPHWCY